MSNLEELIEKLCPDGVEYKYLADAVTIKRGVRLIKKELKDNAKYPVYQNSLIPLGYYDDYNCEANKTMIITAGAAGDIVYSNTRFWAADDCFYFICNRYMDDKFLYYVLMSQQREIYSKVRKASIPRLPRIVIEKLKLPVPPLEVQREIVRILDNFTFLSTELAAELAARQKQYEYYRDLFLSFGDKYKGEKSNVRWVKLGDIGIDFYRGSGIKRNEVTNDGIPCVRYGEIYTSYEIAFTDCISHTDVSYVTNPKYFEYGDILFAITGESIEDIAKSIAYLGSDKCLAGGDIVVMKHNQNPRYLSYALSTLDAIKQKGKGKIKSKVVHASVPSIKEIEIPLPSLEEQEKIANILDNYRFLCNDVSSGLPAEIAARQKQYEYYRDKLLSFKELKKEA